MVGLVGAMVSFEEGHELLRELAGVDVPTTHVERAAEALGARDRRRRAARGRAAGGHRARGADAVPGDGWHGRADAQGGAAGRAGKQPDGSAKTREVKLCTVWSAEGRDDGRHADARCGLGQLLGGD